MKNHCPTSNAPFTNQLAACLVDPKDVHIADNTHIVLLAPSPLGYEEYSPAKFMRLQDCDQSHRMPQLVAVQTRKGCA